MIGPFQWGRGGQVLTPDQVARRREIAEAAQGRAGDTSPVAHWTQGAARVVDALSGVVNERRAERGEAAGMAAAEEYIQGNPVLSRLIGGGPAGAVGMSPTGAPVGPAGAAVMPQGANAAEIRQGLLARGLPEHVADAFILNFQDESGLDPGINERAPIVPGSRGGFGLYQLTGPRRTAYERFAAERGVDPSDVDAQLDWMMIELQGPEARAAQSIFSAPDTGTAAAAIVNDFLRPAEAHRASRVARYTGGGGMTPQGQPVPVTGGGADVVGALAGAMGNPWVQERYGPVIEALMDQQMRRGDAQFDQQLRQSDPMYQAQLAQLTAPAEVDPFAGTQVINGQLVTMGPDGRPQVLGDFNAPDPGFRMVSPEEAMAMGLPEGVPFQMGPDGRVTQIGGSGVNVEVNTGSGEVGTIPPGFELFTDPESGNRSMRAISGGPADESNPSAVASAQQSLDLMDNILRNPALEAVTGLVQGRLPARNQEQQDLLIQIEQLQGQAFMQAFETLKGGGQITEREGAAATAAIARLNRVQSEEEYRRAISELRAITEVGLRRSAGETVPDMGGMFGGGQGGDGRQPAQAPDWMLNTDISTWTPQQMDEAERFWGIAR